MQRNLTFKDIKGPYLSMLRNPSFQNVMRLKNTKGPFFYSYKEIFFSKKVQRALTFKDLCSKNAKRINIQTYKELLFIKNTMNLIYHK